MIKTIMINFTTFVNTRKTVTYTIFRIHEYRDLKKKIVEIIKIIK